MMARHCFCWLGSVKTTFMVWQCFVALLIFKCGTSSWYLSNWSGSAFSLLYKIKTSLFPGVVGFSGTPISNFVANKSRSTRAMPATSLRMLAGNKADSSCRIVLLTGGMTVSSLGDSSASCGWMTTTFSLTFCCETACKMSAFACSIESKLFWIKERPVRQQSIWKTIWISISRTLNCGTSV